MNEKPNIYVLSDLHFDKKALPGYVKQKLIKLENDPIAHFKYMEEVLKSGDYQYSKNKIKQNIKFFIDLLYSNREGNIFVLAGDFFDDFFETLDFIQILEKAQITSFVVLGNHDYWTYSDKKRTWIECIEQASMATERNKFCRLLLTGREYKIGDLVFIGDTGFTNLNYTVLDLNRIADVYDLFEYIDENDSNWLLTATIKDIENRVPDCTQVKNFDIETLKKLNKEWCDFANKRITRLNKNESLFIVTHWPMDSLAENAIDSWWQTLALFPKEEPPYPSIYKPEPDNRYWLISGHTHRDVHYWNSIAVQAGYQNEKWFQDLTLASFGLLVPTEKLYSLIDINSSLSVFTDFSVIYQENNDNAETSLKVRRYGFRRAGNFGNKRAISAYMKNSEDYIQRVKKEIAQIKNEFAGNAGYSDALGWQLYHSKLAVEAAIDVLEKGYQENPFEFFTALLVSGYAYNARTHLLKSMRKVNVYDIVRQSMVFSTIKNIPEINLDEIVTIKSLQGKNSSIKIGNIELKIPVVNGKHLDLDFFLPMANFFNNQLLGEDKPKEKMFQIESNLS